ncbi:helix-turn-helix domain-containing protein [Rhodococcus sp. USK10]|uniref:helix-turn-helix domain-containing protein n=1 Tax=Rhodococcus sp. USK10 TaxID=2789739 RepID=UPI002150F5EC|nr:helix-turn-helix domain-containing protein [Rhodococcus sp. USK10]
MTWVLDSAPVTDSTQAFVLLCLADYANDDSGVCWPSLARIAARARCSGSTARRAIRKLEDAGLVIRQETTNGRGTNRYKIVMNPGQNDTPSNPTGIAEAAAAQSAVIHNANLTPLQSDWGIGGTPVNPTATPGTHDRGPLAPVTPEPSLNPHEPPAARSGRIAQLESAARYAGLSARFDRINEVESVTLESLLKVHSVEALIAHARSQHRADNPARFVSAWIPGWLALPVANRESVDAARPKCGRCDEFGWIGEDEHGRMIRCECRLGHAMATR